MKSVEETASRPACSMCWRRALSFILNDRFTDDLVAEVAAELARRAKMHFPAKKLQQFDSFRFILVAAA